MFTYVFLPFAYSDKLPYEQESKEGMKEGITSKVV